MALPTMPSPGLEGLQQGHHGDGGLLQLPLDQVFQLSGGAQPGCFVGPGGRASSGHTTHHTVQSSVLYG